MAAVAAAAPMIPVYIHPHLGTFFSQPRFLARNKPPPATAAPPVARPALSLNLSQRLTG